MANRRTYRVLRHIHTDIGPNRKTDYALHDWQHFGVEITFRHLMRDQNVISQL